jgi:hypothetical protein
MDRTSDFEFFLGRSDGLKGIWEWNDGGNGVLGGII